MVENKKRILCLVQLPPPIHGAAVMNSHIVENILPNSDFMYSVIDMNFSKTFQEMHGGNVRKVGIAVKILGKLIGRLIMFRPDVVYFPFAITGGALLRDVIYTFVSRLFCSEIYFHLHATGLSERKSMFYRWMYSYLLRHDTLILLSELLYRDVSGFIERERCRILPNAVEGPESWEPKDDANGSRVNILYMANFHPGKGLLTAIDTFAELIKLELDVRLTIVGSYTHFWTEADMISYLAKLDCEVRERILVYGPAYGAEKRDILRASDVFLYPSRHDAFGLVVVEALANGLPVVASMQGSLPDIVINGESGVLVGTDDVGDYVVALERICVNDEYRKEMGRKAWRRYKDSFTFSIFDRKYVEIIKGTRSV